MDIKKSLKTLMESGLTQRDVADALGCSQAHVSDMANGKAGLLRPSAKIVSGIERLLRLRDAMKSNSSEVQIIVSPERKKD